ncbi:MAG TPA: phosphoenolpyruvate--protein phosphotransferase [Opitutae bacterium]|nr:phosphoenolpyruvate--protein phosphotransferase [Opitutae bacterium]|tara:strand:- start:609 stop:2369 length:1761 start_codon:yes stop_codon:yes gene_type:complete
MTSPSNETILYGIPASPGVSHGQVFRFLHRDVEVLRYDVQEDDQDAEIARFEEALLETKDQISKIRDDVARNLGEDEAAIFDAHILVLEDKALIDDVVSEVRTSGDNVEQCLHRVTQRYIDYFSQLEDEYLRERASDLKDISRRLLGNLVGATAAGTAFLEGPRILVSEDLSPSDTASLDRSKILGIATDTGGRTSHAVIMARSSGVPAVVGLRGLSGMLNDGDALLVDGFEGIAIVNPSESTLFRYGKVGLRRKKIKDLLEEEASLPPSTKDGSKVVFLANADSAEEVRKARSHGCEGVGLFRTESIFLRKNKIPSEDDQYEEYREIVESAEELPVTIRTLDLGGDKILDSIGREKEENPFMGFRAIRYCLRNPDVFLDQLRAILRASAHGNVKVMFPMVSGVGELVRAKECLSTAKRQLRESETSFDEEIQVGCMIETPSAVTICDMLATEVDFFSIGTNDLVQYLLAVDRINNEIAYLYEPHHPAVIRSMKRVFDVAREKKVGVTVCGEIAGDPHFLPLLLALGEGSLSAASPMLPELKFFARRFSMTEAEELLERVFRMTRPSEINQTLKDFYEERVSDLVS